MSGCSGTGGHCGCGGAKPESQQAPSLSIADVASVNGVLLHAPGEQLDDEALRQRAYAELLRQAAQTAGLLDAQDIATADGVQSEAASAAIEQLLAQQLPALQPDEAACRRYYAAHAARFVPGERVQAEHILFAVTPQVDIEALRRHAEGLLVELRCADVARFAEAARTHSNCPSGAQGGQLGWLSREDCAPEFAAALFAQGESSRHIGVLPRLVNTRFGFHIVRVLAREAGEPLPFEQVRAAVAQALCQQQEITALRHYLSRLAASAALQGVQLEASDAALVQ